MKLESLQLALERHAADSEGTTGQRLGCLHVFIDVDATDVAVKRLSLDTDDVVFMPANEEVIAFDNQLERYYGIDEFQLADGTTSTGDDLMNAAVADDDSVFGV